MTSQAVTQGSDEAAGDHDFPSARVRSGVVYESGIPPNDASARTAAVAAGVDARIQNALAESARLEMNVRLLVRGLKQLLAATSSVEETHGHLLNELSELRKLVVGAVGARPEDSALEVRVHELEQAVESVRRHAAEEKSALIGQQDAFLQRLLAEHEQEVRELERQLTAPEAEDEREAEVEPQSRAIVPRDELPSAECLEVHWEELEDTPASRAAPPSAGRDRAPLEPSVTMPGVGAPRVPRPDSTGVPGPVAATPAARSSLPPPLPGQARSAAKRT